MGGRAWARAAVMSRTEPGSTFEIYSANLPGRSRLGCCRVAGYRRPSLTPGWPLLAGFRLGSDAGFWRSFGRGGGVVGVFGGGAPVGTAGDVQYGVVEEIVDLVETSCAERPVLLVAEDIHWADSASLLAILSVARQLPFAALLVVVTARPSPLPAEVARLLDDLAAGGARTLQLQPLTPGDVAVLARHVLGASPGPALTAMLANAGGKPF